MILLYNHPVELVPEEKMPEISFDSSDLTAGNSWHSIEDESFDKLAEAIPGGIAYFDVFFDGSIKVRAFNDVFAGLTGRTRKELSEDMKNGEMLTLVCLEDRIKLKESIVNSFASYLPFKSVFRVLKRDGSCVFIRTSANYLKTEGDHAVYLGVFLDITDSAVAEEKIRHQAEFDVKTDIYNRETFILNTREMLDSHPELSYSLYISDIQNFKLINGRYGPETGDRILKKFAAGLKEVAGTEGTYGRFEADHFAFCYPRDKAEPEKIIQTIKEKCLTAENEFHLQPQFGVYEIQDSSIPVQTMCDCAVSALNSIKGQYNFVFAMYDEKLRQKITEEQFLMVEIEKGIENHEFIFYLQPVYQSSTKKMVSAEALVRWQKPGRGLILPNDFIPLMEKNGFVPKLDYTIWEEVCSYLAGRQREKKRLVPVSVNMSRLDIHNPKLLESIVSLTKKYGIDPEYLRFEVTESAYSEDAELLLDTIKALRKEGFRVLMDDFGSGYSSLNVLKDMPVDILKIDREMVGNMEISNRGGAILGSVIRLARRLSINTIAEGVETQSQFEYLRGIGCDSIQGYYFSKPITVASFNALLDTEETPDGSENVLDSIDEQSPARKDRKNILVVDDSSINGTILANMLQGDFNILEADNGRKALELMRRKDKDVALVLLDIVMPVMNGYDVLEEARNDPDLLAMPIVVLTGAETSENEIMALEYGATDFLKKPYNPDIMRIKVANIIRQNERLKKQA